jgi:hypothetical protein
MWPFLQSDEVGAAGLGIVFVPDLRRIEYVTDVTGQDTTHPGRPLKYVTRSELVAEGSDLTQTGQPEMYYVTNGTTINAYPVGGTLRVDYVRRVEPLSGTDEPLFDEEYHNLIIDRAMVKAYIDSDNFEAAATLKAEFELGAAAMAEDYMVESREVQYIEPSGSDL